MSKCDECEGLGVISRYELFDEYLEVNAVNIHRWEYVIYEEDTILPHEQWDNDNLNNVVYVACPWCEGWGKNG
jgi:hypothetical protein